MTSAVAAIIWVLAASVTALLPYRRQFPPGVTLLILAPVLILWIGYENGWIWVVPAVLGFVSMFRNPLIYMAKKALGRPVQRPVDPREGGS